MKKTVYLVTAGSYSDYRVIACCTRLDLANKIAALYRDDETRIETYPLNPSTKVKTLYFVRIDRTNGHKEMWSRETYEWDILWRFARYPLVNREDIIACSVESPEEALKQAEEALKQAEEVK
jgi:hypothetical protein